MKILHIVPSLDLSSGGPSKSVSDLAYQQAKLEHEITVFTQTSENPYFNESPHPKLILHFVKEKSFKKELKKLLIERKFDILHGHGVWQMPVHFMARLAKSAKIPYIITPRGMLEPWALNVGKFKKKLAMFLFQKHDLNQASCIHATADMEAVNIQNLGFKNPIAVIPNGIDISEFPTKNNGHSSSKDRKTLLFLSRIHPKKGIEMLIEAWLQLSPSVRGEWRMDIVGNGQESYIQSLNQIISSNQLESEIEILGPKFGEDKINCYLKASLFVLPTFSENFGVVIAEALACGVPVITTKGAPWEDLNTYNAGWWVDIGSTPLLEAMNNAMKLSEDELRTFGKNGRFCL